MKSHLLLLIIAAASSIVTARATTIASAQDSTNALPHQGCQLLLNEEHNVQLALVGAAYELSPNANPAYHVQNEGGPTAALCIDGSAGGYPCDSVDLLSLLTLDDLNSTLVNDIWGWTDNTSKREFAIIGLREGTAFVEVSNPFYPIYLGFLPSATDQSIWRDIKTFENYALIVSEAGEHGMQVFDLDQLLSVAHPPLEFTADAIYNHFGRAHNVFVNEDTGFAYAVGSDTCSGGLHIVDMVDPLNPTQAGCYSEDGYSHDVQCIIYNGPDSAYIGNEICFASNEDTITIVDVTDKTNMIQISREGYGESHYAHQGWLTDDHAYFIFDDELDELREGLRNQGDNVTRTRTHVMDVRDLQNPIYLGYHEGRSGAVDHNLYVSGEWVYQANYRAGLNVLKIVDIGTMEFEEAGYFDIWPDSNSAGFNGAWSNYPYFPSGIVVVSGIEQGLFVLKFLPPTDAPVAVPPTDAPVITPTETPVVLPTDVPIVPPSDAPIVPPSDAPVILPTHAPVVPPTDSPIVPPTDAPVLPPSDAPLILPTHAPVVPPTDSPIVPPIDAPILPPSDAPIVFPATPQPITSHRFTLPPNLNSIFGNNNNNRPGGRGFGSPFGGSLSNFPRPPNFGGGSGSGSFPWGNNSNSNNWRQSRNTYRTGW